MTDKEMMLNYLAWPQLLLPIVNRKNRDVGVLTPSEHNPETHVMVCFVNMYSITRDNFQSLQWEQKTPDELIEDGWEVD